MLLYVDSNYCSPYAMSSFVALREKGEPFELRRVDLARREHHSESYARLSLTCKVPMLVDKDFALSESSAIAEYIHEVVGGPDLYPGEARLRARARQIQAWLRSDFMALRTERTTEVIFSARNPAPLSGAAQRDADTLVAAALAWLDDGSHACGEWSMADVDLTVMLSRLTCNGDAVPAKLQRYVASQWQRPTLKAWLDLPRPDLVLGV
jgi:glutathione S-transferase